MIDIAPRGIWVTALAVALLTVAVPPSLDLGEEGSEYQLPADRGAQASPSTEWALGSFEPPNRMAIYSHVDDERSAVEALQIAENVGVKVPSIDYDASRGAYYVEDGVSSYEVVVYETPDSFLLRDETIFDTITDGKQPDLPTETEGKELALEYLAESDQLPAEQAVDTAAPDYYWNTQVEVNTTTDEKTVLKTNLQVRFDRQVDGYPASGGGSKLYVHFSDGSHLAGVTKAWPALEKEGSEDLRSLDEAMAMVNESSSDMRMDVPPNCANLKLTSGQIEYHVPGPQSTETQAFPVFSFLGSCEGIDGDPITGEKAQVLVPAVG